MKRLPVLCAVVAMTAMFHAAPAAAEFRVCNRTSYIVYTAVGFETGLQMLTHGWTRVLPGGCALALVGPLNQPEYFVYARSSQAHGGPSHAWGGRIQLCAKETNFAIDVPVGAARCGSDDAFLVPYATVTTGHAASWTMTLTGTRRFGSPAAARDAGIARLLGDIGYKVDLGASDGADSKALADFRARLRLPAKAGDADLFDALETEAHKAAAPAGYSVCNDGQSEVWTAIALRSPRISVVRGWWAVPPGACAKLLTTPLSFDAVYLLAERNANPKLVSGPAAFCVTDVAFEIFGDKNCTARGLTQAGFAATITKGKTGFAAHIGNDGLLPTAPAFTQARAGK